MINLETLSCKELENLFSDAVEEQNGKLIKDIKNERSRRWAED